MECFERCWLFALVHSTQSPESRLTLSSTLRPVQLAKGHKAFSAETLVAALCVPALLGTHAILLTLVHICFQIEKN